MEKIEKLIQKNCKILAKQMTVQKYLIAELTSVLTDNNEITETYSLEKLKEIIRQIPYNSIVANILKGYAKNSEVSDSCGSDFDKFIKYLNNNNIRNQNYPHWTSETLAKFDITKQWYIQTQLEIINKSKIIPLQDMLKSIDTQILQKEKTELMNQSINHIIESIYKEKYVIETAKTTIKYIINKFVFTFYCNYSQLIHLVNALDLFPEKKVFTEEGFGKEFPEFSKKNIERILIECQNNI